MKLFFNIPDIDVDSCAICRNKLLSPCIECQAYQTEGECPVVWGVCNVRLFNFKFRINMIVFFSTLFIAIVSLDGLKIATDAPWMTRNGRWRSMNIRSHKTLGNVFHANLQRISPSSFSLSLLSCTLCGWIFVNTDIKFLLSET